jgi:hypothetical protein
LVSTLFQVNRLKASNARTVYYQAGIGSGIGIYDHIVGGGTGLGLEENIREAYAFLANNYRERYPEGDPRNLGIKPDSIFLIGFSRGAFTARSIGGLIGAVGLLKKKAMPHFYEIFSDWENAGNPKYKPMFFDSYYEHHKEHKDWRPSLELAHDKDRIDIYMAEYYKILLERLDLTQEVEVKCIGVWDTVGALGIPVNPFLQRLFPFLPAFAREYSWFDTRLDPKIKKAFQALALDERRFPFSPTLWEAKDDSKTYLKQVWFPGAHSNVGGSYADAGIADVTLAWMMDQLAGNTTPHPNGDKEPLDWIAFNEDYINYWNELEGDYYEEHRLPQYRGWGMGYIYDTVYFPTSLTGTRTRTPGRYLKTVYATGKPAPGKLLENTNEFIHCSVRARMDLGGRGVEPNWDQVFPNSVSMMPWLRYFWQRITGHGPGHFKPMARGSPLYGWTLDDGHKDHSHDPVMEIDMSPNGQKEVTWVYDGKELCGRRVMPEDKLGPIELKLLEKDKHGENIAVSNNGWKWFIRKVKESPKHGHTF